MAADYKSEAPRLLRDFLSYHQSILNHSPRTVQSYYLDLRMFLRYIKLARGLVADNADFEKLDVPFEERYGMMVLDSKESFKTSYTIEVF